MKYFSKKNPAGYSLIEILVVVGIFSTLSLVTTNIFLLSLQSQRQTSARQLALSELRFVTDSLTRQIRVSEIDYQEDLAAADRYFRDTDSGIAGAEKELHLIDASGDKYGYYLTGTSGGQLMLNHNNVEYPLNDTRYLKVIRLQLYINPPTNPFNISLDRCNGNNNPTGCVSGATCSVSNNSGNYEGFCGCQKPVQLPPVPDPNLCASNNCDPASLKCLPFNFQPRVTIVLGFQTISNKPQEQKTIYFQTTASSRIYKR
jgi:prepilin-type N-terminal cleavage/methylation domain-containing protein